MEKAVACKSELYSYDLYNQFYQLACIFGFQTHLQEADWYK
jgi:hypothetical protein